MAVRHSSDPRGNVAHRERACDLGPARGADGRHQAECTPFPLEGVRGRTFAQLVAAAGLFGLAACSQTAGRAPAWEMFLSGGDPQPQPAAAPLSPIEGVPPEAVEACQNSIAIEARVHGATQVEAVSAGTLNYLPNGLVEAPIEARIVYGEEPQTQIRQARVACRLNEQGSVVELL